MNNQYKDPEYHKKYYQAHKAEISAKRKANYKKEKSKEYKRNYYLRHREEILAKQRAKKAAKKLNNNAWLPLPETKTEPQFVRFEIPMPKLDRIEKALWWIAFAISFVGVAVLFK